VENDDRAEQAVDIKSIIHEIRLGIKEKGYTSDHLGFIDNFDQEFLAHIADFQLQDGGDASMAFHSFQHSWYVQPHKRFVGNPLVVFIKKAIRKLLKFYIVPVVTDQNAINYFVAHSLEKNCALESQITDLYARVTKLEALSQAGKPPDNNVFL